MTRMVQEIVSTPVGFVVVTIAVIALLLFITAVQNRRHLARTERKQCRNCGGLFPADAKFCGRCGKAF